MPYLDRTIRLAFDGTDPAYPQLGDDIWVVIKNPLLMPASAIQTDTNIQVDANGNPVDRNAAMEAGFEIASRLVVSWNVYDPDDSEDNPAPLPLPATPHALRILPLSISNAISEIVGKALAPKG